MLNVAHKITMGSATLTSGKTSTLHSLEIHADLNVPVNSCSLIVDGQGQLSVKSGDSVKVQLGYDSSLETVFTGTVASVQHDLQCVTVEALSSFVALTQSRFNAVYAKQASGDIAGDLMGKLSVGKNTVDTGVKFAAYAVSDGQTVWEVLHQLALSCGFDFYADTDDRAMFKAYSAALSHTLQYGADILDYEHDAAESPWDGVEVYGESPAGQGQGDDASTWLTKKPVKGSAGMASGQMYRVVNPAARSQSVARTLASNLYAASKVKETGSVRVLGAPKVKLGDAIQITKMPESSDNGTFKVTGVSHRLSERHGFTTRIDWEKN